MDKFGAFFYFHEKCRRSAKSYLQTNNKMSAKVFKKFNLFSNNGINRYKSLNSHNWLARREKDRYVELAKTENYR